MTMKGSDDILLLVEMVMNDKLSRTATETNREKVTHKKDRLEVSVVCRS